MGKRGIQLELVGLTVEERAKLTDRARCATAPFRMVQRARIVLRCAESTSLTAIARELGVHPTMVGKWRRRFLAQGIEGLQDEFRPGAPRRITDADIEKVLVLTLNGDANETMPWSRRSIGRAVGVSADSIGRIWQAFDIKPQRKLGRRGSECIEAAPAPLSQRASEANGNIRRTSRS